MKKKIEELLKRKEIDWDKLSLCDLNKLIEHREIMIDGDKKVVMLEKIK